VVPNLYPIVGGETVGDVAVGAGGGVVPATGTHEVVVLSPSHHRSFAALDDGEAVEVVGVLRDRVAAHLRAGHRYAIALMNHGRAAGASIAHPHAQVVALDFVPPEVVAADRRAVDAGVDLIASDLADARAHGSVLSEQGARSWFPYAGGGPFVARVAAPTAGHRFDLAADDLLARVALALRDTLAQLRATLGDPAYNVTVHTAAADDTGPRRWYVEVTPRLGVVAGFEMATGVLVSTTPAEQAAALVRAACPGAHPR
jgi:UDPglucose--hexose-1-phosphate uridylyltransferase